MQAVRSSTFVLAGGSGAAAKAHDENQPHRIVEASGWQTHLPVGSCPRIIQLPFDTAKLNCAL